MLACCPSADDCFDKAVFYIVVFNETKVPYFIVALGFVNQMTTPTYPGNPLESGEFRLIRLLPGEWLDVIACELFGTKLDRADYRALSYVWGSQGKKKAVFVNDIIQQVTVNLESALRHLRQQYQHGVVLWIDALCIDQKSDEERTHQVQLMGSIYSKSREVIVYLGDYFEGTRRSKEPPDVIFSPMTALTICIAQNRL